MSVTIKIRVNKLWNGNPIVLDVSNDVVINSLEIIERADLSLECGSFKFISNSIDYNIPPYSLCQITDDTGAKYYCVSSECNSYLTTGKWVHDCTLLALESYLEGYILGTKAFSLTSTNVYSDHFIAIDL